MWEEASVGPLFERLAAANLPLYESVTHLHVSGCKGVKGVEHIKAFVTKFSKLESLRTLPISGFNVLESVSYPLRKLTIEHDFETTAEEVASVKGVLERSCPKELSFMYGHVGGLDYEIMPSLDGLEGLRCRFMEGIEMKDVLRKIPLTLRVLELDMPRLKEKDLREIILLRIEDLNLLREFAIMGLNLQEEDVWIALAKALADKKHLRRVSFARSDISEKVSK